MSRPWRIEYEGALYHLLSRGNAGSAIFVDDKDRSRFLDAVGEMSQWFDIDIFEYVLMDNHFHSRKRNPGYAALRYLENRPAKK
jgi:REP element-mobilizing transposase RayT